LSVDIKQNGDDSRKKTLLTFVNLFNSMRKRLLTFLNDTNRWQPLNAGPLQNQALVSGDVVGELHHLLLELLSSKFTDHGMNLDYAALQASALYHEFRDCTRKLGAFDPSILGNQNAQRAFWINLYNMLVLDGVIVRGLYAQHRGRQIGRAFFTQVAYIVGGQCMSCDDIEHGILRANRRLTSFGAKYFRRFDPRLKWVIEPLDPRVHFALNCSSQSCPPIRVYSPENLDSELDLAARSHLATNIKIGYEMCTLYLSPIFKWFAADFGEREGILKFVLSHFSEETESQWLTEQRDRILIRYTRYDWRLNSKVQLRNV
jgi:hypothetical protein